MMYIATINTGCFIFLHIFNHVFIFFKNFSYNDTNNYSDGLCTSTFSHYIKSYFKCTVEVFGIIASALVLEVFCSV